MSNANWNGAPLILNVGDSANMPQTTNGSMVFVYINTAQQNNAGTLSLTSGGNPPQSLYVPALANQPSVLVNNWLANNLNVVNISANTSTPIWIEAYGPGLPGQNPSTLVIGTPLKLGVLQSAKGTALPNWMQLAFTSTTQTLSIFTIIGGPLDATGNNAYVIAINSPSGDTGPGTGTPAPAGYYATRGGNSYTLQFNWGSSTIYVSNMSPSTAALVTVTLRSV